VDVFAYSKKLGIENHIIFFGEVEEKALKVLYRKSDIFCLLSRHDECGVPEGIPVVLMEAMSMGKPVIATNTGATNELVEEILIDEEDVQAATNAIRRLVEDPELRTNMGRRNHEITVESYSEDNIIKLYDVLCGT
jgi:colanic acid/amylovoran biosynthesis glycosyltransferase